MIKIKKTAALTTCVAYLKTPFYTKNFFNKRYSSKILTPAHKLQFSRLVFVRSPKHFNKGKIQVLFSNTSLRLIFLTNIHISFKPQNIGILYSIFSKNLYFLPFIKVQHYKVFFKQKVVFYYGNKKSTI